jgi:hypothetical protein
MIETNKPLLRDIDRQGHAHWADKKPRGGFDVSRFVSHAIIRARPFLLKHLTLLIAAASGAVVFLAARYALRGTA